jgi:hypothetical protein
MRVDTQVLTAFKARAQRIDGNYQTLMNEALKESAQGMHLADVVRDAVRETLRERLGAKSKGRPKKLRVGV